jgi:hypothetical protein
MGGTELNLYSPTVRFSEDSAAQPPSTEEERLCGWDGVASVGLSDDSRCGAVVKI